MAIALTFVAGSLPLWGIADGSTRMTGAIYLAIGILVAWIIARRNVPTEIHGPFQSNDNRSPFTDQDSSDIPPSSLCHLIRRVVATLGDLSHDIRRRKPPDPNLW
jgi:hypothetical protein